MNAPPFGSPDAANDAPLRRAANDDQTARPFEMTELSAYASLASIGSDPLVRVLVGQRGTGKTRYLIELREGLAADDSCELTEIEFDLPNLAHVIQLAKELENDPVEREEVWRELWERAIVNAALSRISHDVSKPASLIYKEFGRILRDHPTLGALRQWLADPTWDHTHHDFERAMADYSRSLCFFLDVLEEDTIHVPYYFQWCHKGLVTQVLRFARTPVLADKLRIFLAIRNQTWALLQRTTPTAKLVQHPLVRVLRWDAHAAADFLNKKVKGLPSEYFLGDRPTGEGTTGVAAAWLGTDCVSNIDREVTEELTTYLLRHTRLIPRDIVMMGNLLAEHTVAARECGDSRLSDDRIRLAVAESARLSAAEELQWCGLEIVSKQLLHGSSIGGRSRTVHDEDAAILVTEKLRRMLAACGEDIVTQAQFAELSTRAQAQFNVPLELAELLWKHGLIGWSDSASGPFIFALRSTYMSTAPPLQAGHFAMHPILIDALPVRPAGKVPVLPFAVEELL